MPESASCPLHDSPCQRVSFQTVLQHVQSPWSLDLSDENYYFCSEPECDAVYFTPNGLIIRHDQMRTPIWQKTQHKDDLLCYCFGVSLKQAVNKPSLRDFVIDNTRQGLCSCDSRNPSGRCCLKDFPRDKTA